MIPTSISVRVVGLATGLLLLISAVAAPPALARAACNNDPVTSGTADIAVTQVLSGPLADTNDLDTVTITNYGPCNVPNVGLVLTLPGSFQFLTSSNPSAWTCQPSSEGAKCWETSTIGVPGTAVLQIEYAVAGGTVIACAATFTGTPPPATCDPAGGPVPDIIPGNNTSYAGSFTLGAPLTYGPGTAGLTTAFNHSTSLGCPSQGCGGFAQIYQTPASTNHVFCPPEVPNCFLGTITIETNAAGPKSWTLSFLASLAGKKSLSQITVWNSDGGAFGPVPNCNAKLPPGAKCVQDRSRATINGLTVYTIVVVGTVDNGMTAD